MKGTKITLSRVELADRAGIHPRSIQMYLKRLIEDKQLIAFEMTDEFVSITFDREVELTLLRNNNE